MILLDTAPLVALCDPRDALNRRALRDLDRLAQEPLVLCLPVLTEACFLLPYQVQRERLRRPSPNSPSRHTGPKTNPDCGSRSSPG